MGCGLELGDTGEMEIPNCGARKRAHGRMKTVKARKIPQLKRGGAPGRGRGRIQLAARRSLYDCVIVSTADVAQTAFARKTLLHGRRLEPHDYRLARAALRLIAVPIGRAAHGSGRPMLWRLRDMGAT